MGNILWDEIEHRYVTGNESYKALAKEFKIQPSRLGKYARNNKWVDKRKEYRTTVLQSLQADDVQRAVEGFRKLNNTTQKAIDSISMYFNSAAMTYSPQEFRQLTGALKDLTAVLGDIYGLLDDNKDDDGSNAIKIIIPEGMEDYAN